MVIYPSLVLVQPRKTRPCLTEILLMGRKESIQTNKTEPYWPFFVISKMLLYGYVPVLYHLAINQLIKNIDKVHVTPRILNLQYVRGNMNYNLEISIYRLLDLALDSISSFLDKTYVARTH